MIIKIYFQTISEKSSKSGEFESMGEYDIINVDTVADVLDAIEDYGYLEPSSSEFHNGIWYTTSEPDTDLKTGIETYYTIHFNDASEVEQRSIYKELKAFGLIR